MVTRNTALVVVIFGGVCAWCTATPACAVGREYVVDNCVRYRCIFGRATPDPCPSGLFPSYKVGTGCSWPRESECTTDLETGKIIDPCSGDPCLNGGRCIASSNGQSYLCSCPAGYQGARCEINENECLSGPCKNGGVCVDEQNGFRCQCTVGAGGVYFTGPLCETQTSKLESVCTPNPCQNEGYCFDTGEGSFFCYCRPAFTGPLCNQSMEISDPCSSRPCLNSGICSSVGTSQFKCFCSPGYTGTHCEHAQDPCISNPCLNGGICFKLDLPSFGCACPEKFTGSLCETAVSKHPCDDRPCKNGGYCMQVGSTYKCYCRSGYTGPDCSLATSAIISNQCSGGTDLLPHPTYCQLYYNCSAPTGNIPSRPQEQYLDECPYPQLFSAATNKCEPFYRVECGQRQVLVDYCDYWKQVCTSTCKPCYIDHPSCSGLTDGIHGNPNKPNTPYFMSCYQNRTVYTSECRRDRLGTQMVYHGDKCTSVFQIAKAEGGRRPECPNDTLGTYPDPNGDCALYYMCQEGVATMMQCTDGLVYRYEPDKPLCQDPADVCEPCGRKSCNTTNQK